MVCITKNIYYNKGEESIMCDRGGIGRHVRLRGVCLVGIWVQVPSVAP